MKDWPYEVHPTGWFMVDWADNLAVGQVKPLHYFGEDLVLWRGQSGAPQVMSALCPHLGAHIGYGGHVCGDDVVCPFHGWRYRADGSNSLIPPNERGNPSLKLRTYPTREIDGFVLMWYDVNGAEPNWEWEGVPEYRDLERFYPIYPHGAHCYGKRAIQPQSMVENMADVEHFPYVHGAGGPGIHMVLEEGGHYIRAVFAMRYGAHGKPTFLTPNGPVDGEIEAEAWGLGLTMARATIGDRVFAQMVTVTPIDLSHGVMWSTITGSREPDADVPGGLTARMFKFQHDQVGNDVDIWEHQRWLAKPLYAEKEGRPFVKVRRWSKRFYPDRLDAADSGTSRRVVAA